MHLARPVHMVFEYDRFRVVHQVEVPQELVSAAPPGIEVAPWGAPTLLSLRPFRNAQEDSELWQPSEAGREQVLRAARPITQLKSRLPQRAAEIDTALQQAGREATAVAYLPLVARKDYAWTVLLDAKTAEVIGYLPLDSF